MKAIELVHKILDIIQIEGHEVELCIRAIQRSEHGTVTSYKEVPILSVKECTDASGKCGIRMEAEDFYSAEWRKA